jgi:translation initiation factor 3 subunit B
VQTDGYKLDKNHTFKVSMFDDFDRYAKVPDVYAAPEIKEYSPTVSWSNLVWQS